MAKLHRIVIKLLKEKFVMSEFHVMGAFMDPCQTNKIGPSMDSRLGKVVAEELCTLAIDESLEDWVWHFRMVQDDEATSEDEREGQGKEHSSSVFNSLRKECKSVFDDSDEEINYVVVTKSEIENFMELVMTVPSKCEDLDI